MSIVPNIEKLQAINKLHRAYMMLDLDPGASPASVRKQYTMLTQIWNHGHLPAIIKEHAAQKMKAINAAKELLEQHFKDIDSS